MLLPFHVRSTLLLFYFSYYKDQANAMDSILGNGGAIVRKNLAMSGAVDFEGVLHVDLAQQDKAILNGVQIGVKLYQHDNSFRLMANNSYEFAIEDAELKVCYLRLSPSMLLAHNERLSKGPALYPYYKSNVKAFAIPTGSHTWSMDDIFHGTVPQRLIVALVDSKAYAGDLTLNPFNFKNYGLNFLEFAKDGRSIPAAAFQPKFTANAQAPGEYLHAGYINEFYSLFQNSYPQEQAGWIQRGDFPGGQFIVSLCCTLSCLSLCRVFIRAYIFRLCHLRV